jgi:DNA polymerase-1
VRVIGGMKADADNRIRTTFTHNPSTLRLSSADPNLQNIPRGGEGYSQFVKDIFVAPEGYLFIERDFSAIEAVLVGYFAGSARYIRFAKLGVHDFLLSHMIGQPADLSLSDKDLKALFKSLKKAYPTQRDAAKRVVHGSNYQMSARRMHELFPEFFPTERDAKRLQDLYFQLFPEIRVWHRNLCNHVDGTKRRSGEDLDELDPWTLGVCFARNPFGYVHRFYDVLAWRAVILPDGTKEWVSEFGEDSKRLVAFLPQSTAAAIIKRAAKIIFYQYPWIGQYLRLLVHDSIIFECPEDEAENCLRLSAEIMEGAIPELPLDPTWGMGEFLTISSEAKIGKSWGDMGATESWRAV